MTPLDSSVDVPSATAVGHDAGALPAHINMNTDTSASISPHVSSARSSTWLSRLGWLFWGLIPLAVVITATQVTPQASGMGTHQQLGLPPCGFLLVTGIPCPGCGLTTSFAHMVRAEFTGATYANPFGVMLFFVTFFTIPVAAIGFFRGSPVLDTLERLHAEKWAILLSITSLLVWGVRVARHLLH